MDKFISGGLSTSIHGIVTYCVVGNNKKTVIDEGNSDIEIERENIKLDREHYITRLKITNTSGTMMKLINAYPFISDDFRISDTQPPQWLVLNSTRQVNDIPSACCLGIRDDAFKTAVDRLSEEGIMLRSCSGGDAVLSGDRITVIKAGKTYVSVEMLSCENQLSDISLSVDCNGNLKAIRAGGDFNCLLEPGDIKITEWVRISVSGNYVRLIDEYADHGAAVYNEINRPKRALVYELSGDRSADTLKETLISISHLKAPFDYFEIKNGWQKNFGDWEPSDRFSAYMREETKMISDAGYKPGIWTAPFIIDRDSEIYEEGKKWMLRHADGSVCTACIAGKDYAIVDVSAPEALEWLEILYQRLSAFGFYFHNVDYTNMFMLQKDVVLSNPTLTVTEAYVNAMRVIKNAIGSEGYLYVKGGYFNSLAGIADGVQICSELKNFTDNARAVAFAELVNQIVYRGFMNKWWNNSCGSLINENIFTKTSNAQIRTILACEYMCGGTAVISNVCTNEEIKLMRHFYPYVNVSLCSRSAFSDMPYVEAADVEVNNDWHTLCFFNHGSEEVSLIFKLDSKTCGGYVDHASCYDVSSYFGRVICRNSKYDDIIKLGRIAPGSAEIVKIIKSDKPHILLSDMHMSFGGEVEISYDENTVAISGNNPFNCRGNYLAALPEGWVCDDGKNEFSFTVNGYGGFRYVKNYRLKGNVKNNYGK